ncbi:MULTISPECIES: hypothetical protein [Photobacterium]|jgi:hypothetical protein|uniref:Uncharacterized protein n=1 Tax=Photobacterium iliopiscarium TaxID=56192 RepID=A0A0D8P5A9_9GAMM|nr:MULTISPECIES: hypothetical protein [Photobacterium]KJG13850.1 hypothetical protein UB38_07380 [Photobacterium iliopiscarium]KJG20405.1 hypothetical protein UB37_14505 [Photobacterium iliopiscarium]MCD9531799.1 hypothetical protein [Photobacterium carnosum]MCD9536698.1 hypothetical protein [Photobacterium carnosum]MCD9543335.1 hypothetical protein [Photobacterium carnosum]
MFPQATILDPLFWMGLGALQLFLFWNARYWAKSLRLKMNGWKWSAVIGWWFSFLLTIAGAFTLLGENEGNAGWYFLGVVGTGLVIIGFSLAAFLIWLRDRQVQ